MLIFLNTSGYFWTYLDRYCKYAWMTESGNSELVDDIANSEEAPMESTMADYS